MIKAKLLEPQFPVGIKSGAFGKVTETQISRDEVKGFIEKETGIIALPVFPANERRLAESKDKETNGESKGFYTDIKYGTRDSLRDESPKVTEPP